MIKCRSCSSDIREDDTLCPTCNTPVKQPFSLIGLLRKLDAIIGVSCLSAMLIIVVFQIVLRNLFHSGISDADVLVRHLVLWVVFLGAGIASRENKHINIDVIPRLLSPPLKKAVALLISLFSTAVSGILCYAAVYFVKSEYQSGLRFSTINLPVWWLEVIIPAGYAFITFYFIVNGITGFIGIAKGKKC